MTSAPGSPLLLRLREAKASSIPSKTASGGRADVARRRKSEISPFCDHFRRLVHRCFDALHYLRTVKRCLYPTRTRIFNRARAVWRQL